MVKSIPPRTVLDKRRIKAGGEGGLKIIRRGVALEAARTPKEWIYETKPVFKRVKEPLVDVFKEAEEVRIIIDLGSFRRGEIDIDIKPNKYIITAIHGKEVFKEEIALPEDVDIDNTEEHFKNGILELVLPKKRSVK